ncbi:hypothetical protein D9619_001428 [Psilocybe cf. subviscida]|uniref:FCP1 homology domain-containing protein n=1 Tax=Psilocybe cf. subviscida TaxID=2480587 RepID=A0A8H5BCN2_9AGAR|nr:hypothetical protein D9619_001428 [Psilocybe cf. subviscida]
MSHGTPSSLPESHQPAPTADSTATHADSDSQQLALPGPSTAHPRDTSSAATLLPPQTHGEASVHDSDLTHDASTKLSTSPQPSSQALNTMPSPQPQKPRANGNTAHKPKGFFSKLVRILVPCISPSPAAHPVELEETPKAQPEEKTEAKPVEVEKAATPPSAEAQAPPANATPAEPPKPLIVTTSSRPVTPLNADDELHLPPTPTAQLLPVEETAGMTSGSVQPPGSKGESPVDDKTHLTPPHSADGDESEGTNYSEDEVDEQEDEEDRLIFNGGAGIPIGPDGIPKPLLPPISPQHAGRKCLVLDLDETLVHSSFKSIAQADYVVPVEIEYHWHNVYVIKRPGVDNFLKEMGKIYEVVVFTASLSKYADPVLDKLDIHQVVSHRLFRESCYNHRGNYVKDLSQLGRPIADTIILDNSPASYIFHPNNAVPVSSWFNDPHDTELTDLIPFLADLATVDDVRGILDGAR